MPHRAAPLERVAEVLQLLRLQPERLADRLCPIVDVGPVAFVSEAAAEEILFIVQKFFIVTQPANWQYYSPEHEVVWDPQFPQAPVMTYNEDGSPNLIPNLHKYYQEKYKFPQTLKAPPKPDVPPWPEP